MADERTQKAALEGLTVLDLTQFLSGPFCTMNLGDLGAEVVKIERPDRPVGSGPFLNGERVYDLSLNRSKKGITLNLKNPKEKEIFLRLAEQADILIENFKPGAMDKMGLGYEDVRRRNPRIIYASISGFGHTGPYRAKGAMDMVIQGMSGIMSLTGSPDGRPMKAGFSVSDLLGGFYALVGILAALHHRDRTGEGQHIDIAMLDASFACVENAVANYYATGKVPTRVGNRHQVTVPFQPYRTRDGEIIITAPRNDSYAAMCRALGREELIGDPRFRSPEDRRQHVDELENEITRTTIEMTMAEVDEKLSAAGVPTGRINTIAQIAADPQIREREMVITLDHPVAGLYKTAGSPLKMSETPARPVRPAPVLGEHTREIFREKLGMSSGEIDEILEEQQKLLRRAEPAAVK